LIACCQALGQIGDPASIEPLAKILRPKSLLLWKKRYSDEVRANAAFALTQINDPRIDDLLRRCAQDEDQRVREIARSVLGSENEAPAEEEAVG
jgi:HEAT repeat protein